MLDKLEYSEIIKILSSYCKTYIGKEFVLNLKPSFGFSKVNHLLAETQEAIDITVKKSNIPVCEIPNINIYLATNKSISLTFASKTFITYLK